MKAKTSVGILMNTLDMGGAEKQSLLQAKLMGEEFDVHYIVQKIKPRLKKHLDFIEKENINYIQLSGNIIARSFQLRRYIRKNKIRVIFAYLTSDNFLASTSTFLSKTKCIGGVRSSSLPFVKFYVTRFLQKYFLDFTIFNNHYGKDVFIKRGFSPEKSLVIHNCINNIQSEIVRPEGNPVKILSVGRFTAQKDYLTALRAIQLLGNLVDRKIFEYVIVGDGELNDHIHGWIKELQLSNVTVVRNPDRIDNYYIDADIYLLSSDSEGLPNSIMEALNYSLPVVSTDVGDSGYLVKNGFNGFIVRAKDPQLLAERLSGLISDHPERIAFGLNGHKLLVEEFSEKKFQKEYIRFTRRLLSED
jgi:glycosyltransferase involved in cell wall biosynthesis